MGFFDPPKKPNYRLALLFHAQVFGIATVRVPIDGEWRMQGQAISWIGYYSLQIDCTVCIPDTGLDP